MPLTLTLTLALALALARAVSITLTWAGNAFAEVGSRASTTPTLPPVRARESGQG